VEPGCSHCGSGREWKIIGPTFRPTNFYVGWSDLSVHDEVERLNEIFEAGRKAERQKSESSAL